MKFRHGKKGQVYCLHDIENGICRIGKTDSTNGNRQKQQLGYYPFELIVFNEDVPNTLCFEKYLHDLFNEKRKKGDWFKITPNDFLKAVNDARKTYVKIKEENDKKEKSFINNTIFSNIVYNCDYCKFSTIHEDLFKRHNVTCKESPNRFDACIDCKFCKRVDKIVLRKYKQKNREPKEVKSSGFVCEKLNKKMFPRHVIKYGIVENFPEAFIGETLMPNECEYFEY